MNSMWVMSEDDSMLYIKRQYFYGIAYLSEKRDEESTDINNNKDKKSN